MTLLALPSPPWTRSLGYWLTAYRRTWRGSAFSSFLAPLLYLGSLGFGLGSLVDRGGDRLGGVPYAVFVAPGVLAANAMIGAVGEATYPVVAAVHWQRQYLAQLATPLGVGDVLAGHVAFVALRIGLGSAVFVAVGAVLGAFPSGWSVLAVPVAVLTGLVHGVAVMAFAVTQDGDAAFPAINRFVVVPLFLFAGTFFPVSQLPWGLRAVARVTPLWHGTELSRDLALGRAGPADLGHLGYLLVLLAIAGLAARRSYAARLAHR